MNQNQSSIPITISSASASSFEEAHGQIPYDMTNDYMFRAVLQSNNRGLKGLICSLLHLSEAEVLSVEFTNPIVLGQSFKSKKFRLDINVRLNNHTLINLEMQQDYAKAMPIIHIGFLDYILFYDLPEFYSTYKLINVKKHQIYSDSLTLSVVNLTRTDLATDEDREEYYQDLHSYEQVIAQKASMIAEMDTLLAEKEALTKDLLAKMEQQN